MNLRILLPVHGTGPGVGSEDYNLHLARGLAARGHDVTLIGPNLSREEYAFTDRIETPPAPPPSGVLWRVQTPLALRHARMQLRRVPPRWDVMLSGLLPPLRAAFREWPNLPKVYVPLSPLARRELETYGGDAVENRLSAFMYGRMQREAWHRADAVVSFTERITTHRVRALGTRRGPLVISAPGVELDLFTPGDRDADLLAEQGIPPGAPLIVAFSRLIASKGLSFLLRAFARPAIPRDAYLLVLGTGPELGALTQLARDLGVQDRVRFAGFQRDVHRYLRLGLVYAFPSTLESFGFTIVQAMASGLPVVARRSDFHRVLTSSESLIEEGTTGFLVSDEDEMAKRLALVLGDDNLRGRLGAAAARQARERFSWERHTHDVESALVSAIRKTGVG